MIIHTRSHFAFLSPTENMRIVVDGKDVYCATYSKQLTFAVKRNDKLYLELIREKPDRYVLFRCSSEPIMRVDSRGLASQVLVPGYKPFRMPNAIFNRIKPLEMRIDRFGLALGGDLCAHLQNGAFMDIAIGILCYIAAWNAYRS